MSEPIRYDVGMTEETNSKTGFYASFPHMYPDKNGKYVLYDDYATQQAEIDALYKIKSVMIARNSRLKEEMNRLHKETLRLSKEAGYVEMTFIVTKEEAERIKERLDLYSTNKEDEK